jgi:hypothetical protein
MDTILYFDVEDSVSPPENGADDIVLWLAQTLDRHGLKGSFHIIGDKVRTMAQRRRDDIFAALRRHDVSSHYNTGSVHPTTTALVAASDWEGGVAIAMEREIPGFADIQRIAGKCTGLTRHGGSYAPQIVHAAGRDGRVFYGLPFHPPRHRAFWFAGTLCFSSTGLIFTDDNQAGPAALEGVYPNTAAFDAQLITLGDAISQTAAQWSFTALFGSHPHRMNATQFACWNHYHGVNRHPPQPPPLRPEAERQTIRANFERYAAFLASRRELAVQGLDDLQRAYGSRPTHVSRPDLLSYARAVLAGDDVPLHDTLSPAELLVALAHAVQGKADAIARAHVIGPKRLPREAQAMEMSRAEVLGLARALLDAVGRSDERCAVCLPESLPHAGGSVPLSALLGLWSSALTSDEATTTLRSAARAAYPRCAQAWRSQIQAMATWRVFPPNLDLSTIIDLSCAQAWSVAPAQRS